MPLPTAWNPLEALDVGAPATRLSGTKLRRALASDESCLAALSTGVTFDAMSPLDAVECGIDPRVLLARLGSVALGPLETTCAVALRAAMWEPHSLRPAADMPGSPIMRLRHQGSYNCRLICGGSDRLSTHADARAPDVR